MIHGIEYKILCLSNQMHEWMNLKNRNAEFNKTVFFLQNISHYTVGSNCIN